MKGLTLTYPLFFAKNKERTKERKKGRKKEQHSSEEKEVKEIKPKIF